jgi:tetratricopeptide (TPR) repeat protein
MSKALPWTTICLAAVCWLSSGCDRPPAAPRVSEPGTTNVLTVAPDDAAEVKAVMAMETARVNYRHRLEVLEGHFLRVGDADKLNWTRQELKGLAQAQTFQWDGLPEILPPEKGENVEQADERILVEWVAAARKTYVSAVSDLAALYERQGRTVRANIIRSIEKRFDAVRTYLYFLDAEIPGPDLRPVEVKPEAEELFDRAYKLFIDGKGILHTFVSTDYNKERQALMLFREMIAKYPRSTRIALAAYYIADIYKEYFNEDVRAVKWYERAWQWDPNLTEPARFQAATVYDYRLKNCEKAVECYEAAIQHEQFNQSNVRFAQRRIQELTGQ